MVSALVGEVPTVGPLCLRYFEDHLRQELAAIATRPKAQVKLPVLAQHVEAVVVAAGIDDHRRSSVVAQMKFALASLRGSKGCEANTPVFTPKYSIWPYT